jgi:phosphatidylethanolamine-binding protein (PEBP) family uncharacterized protein
MMNHLVSLYVGSCASWPQSSFFTIYALDKMLDLEEPDDHEKLQKAMKGHILGKGRLTGKHGRKK